jgi:NTF2 fold immunity protein
VQRTYRCWSVNAFAMMLLAVSVLAVGQSAPPWPPNSGFVPDSGTALKIAEAVLVPIIGEQDVLAHRPFRTELQGETWTVTGTLNCPTANCVGGAPVVKLSKRDGRILSVAIPK